MRIVFAGTPDFAATALESILSAGHDVRLVLTQPDRPSGRGMKTLASPVKRLAKAHSIPIRQPQTLRDSVEQAFIREARPEVLVVAAYGLILPQEVLDVPPLGALNIHASLLPRWRGAAPIQRAILAGDERTGITIMQMDAGLDTGSILVDRDTPIRLGENSASLHDRLAVMGAELIIDTLAELNKGPIKPRPQPVAGVSYANKLSKSEAELNWRLPVADILRAVRAYNPVPGAYTSYRGAGIKIWCARSAESPQSLPEPGVVEILPQGRILVGCGDSDAQGSSCIELIELQRAGGRRLKASEFLLGFPIVSGNRFA